jgi:hypothetical protein
LPAYDQVKVWTIEPDKPKPREVRPRPRIERRWSPRPAPVKIRFDWWTDEYSVWARLAVVALLGTSILWWPYSRSCGFGLSFYLMASTMIVVGGLWIVTCTWIQRMARTHAVAMIIALWGVTLVMREVLPRVGYARTSPDSPVTWLCR